MSHTIIFKTDYGHILDVLVEEYDELTGLSSPADLSLYTTREIIAKKPNNELVYLSTTPSGLGHLLTTLPSGFLSVPGYYLFSVLLENDLQRFHSAEFGTKIITHPTEG